MKSLITLCGLILSLAFLPLGTAQETPSTPPADKAQPSQANWWKQRNESLNKNLKENPCDLLFIGDSITQGWEGAGKDVWSQYFAPFNASNFGISGDRTEQVLARMEESKLETPHAPKVCVIMIGTNNTGHYKAKQSPEDTAAGIKAIAKGFTNKFPKTQVILLNIFPRGANPEDALRIHNQKINDILNKWKEKNVRVVDIGHIFLKEDGTFKPGMTGDRLHFTKLGYGEWASALVPYLKKYFPQIEAIDKEAKTANAKAAQEAKEKKETPVKA